MPSLFGSESSIPLLFISRAQSTNSNSLNTANYRYASLFKTNATTNITGVAFRTTDVTGSPTIKCDLFAVDANLLPTGSSLANGTVAAVSQTDQSITFGSAYTPTSNTIYILVFSNSSADPTTAHFKLGVPQNAFLTSMQGVFTLSTDGGTNWGLWQQGIVANPLLASGSYGLTVFGNFANDGGDGANLYNVDTSRLAYNANKCIFPFAFSLHTIHVTISKTGSPNFSLVAEVIDGSGTSLGTSTPVPVNNTTDSFFFVFTTPISLSASTDYYIGVRPNTLGTVGDSSNYYKVNKSEKRANTQTPSWLYDAYHSTNWGSRSWTAYSNGDFLAMDIYGIPTAGGGSSRPFGPATFNGGFQ